MAQHRSPRPGRLWVVPTIVVAVVAVLLTVVVTMRGASQDEAGPGGSSDQPGQEQETASTGESLSQDDQVPAPAPRDPLAEGPPAHVEGPPEPDAAAAESRDPEELLAAGPADAPVVLVVFSDYQCPFCAQWSHETLPVLMQHAQDGDLRIEWRDINLFGEASVRASQASYAAALQDGFWEYHDALFPQGQIRSESELSEEALFDLARDQGLDGEQFAADFHDSDTAAQVDDNAQLGLDLGAYSTPTFLLGGEPIVGAQPTEVFTAAFESALAAAEGM